MFDYFFVTLHPISQHTRLSTSIMDKKTILHILFLLAISAGLYYITQSFFMSLGILMLLLLIDSFLRQYDSKRRREWEERRRQQIEEQNQNKNKQ